MTCAEAKILIQSMAIALSYPFRGASVING
jgi:hypothetical protein